MNHLRFCGKRFFWDTSIHRLGNDVAYLVGVSVDEDIEGAVFICCGDLDFRDDVVDSLVSKIIKLIWHIKQVFLLLLLVIDNKEIISQ